MDPSEQREIDFLPEAIPYPESLSAALNKQFDHPTASDVKFNINGRFLYASSIILSERSEYFKNSLPGNLSDEPYCPRYNVTISDSYERFKEIIRFLYGDKIPYTE